MWWWSQRRAVSGEYAWTTRISTKHVRKIASPCHNRLIVDASIEHEMLSFLNAFFVYDKIPMHPPDAEKTTFITPHGLYCYNVMPFGLKNVGVTYQRLLTKIFQPLMGKTMEVYIDDILVKSKERPDHTKHLEETFELLLRTV